MKTILSAHLSDRDVERVAVSALFVTDIKNPNTTSIERWRLACTLLARSTRIAFPNERHAVLNAVHERVFGVPFLGMG